MNFFQSVFSDDPEPDSPQPEPSSPNPNPNPNPNPSIQSITSAWAFSSSLLQTLASKSESVLQTYRHDLQEFTSGLKKETDVIRDKADVILEKGVESLESVGEAIDNLGNTVTSILKVNYIDNDHNNNNVVINDNTSRPFSRVDALIRTARSDAKTYLNDPEDVEEFKEWRESFSVDAFKGEELSWDVDEDEYEEKETVKNEDKEVKPDVKVGLGSEGKTTDRDSDISIVSTQPSPEEDGWDEIEDIGSSDENKDKGVSRGSPDRAELRKRLGVVEDDEDLTWDIEDDDDDDNKPVKA